MVSGHMGRLTGTGSAEFRFRRSTGVFSAGQFPHYVHRPWKPKGHNRFNEAEPEKPRQLFGDLVFVADDLSLE